MKLSVRSMLIPGVLAAILALPAAVPAQQEISVPETDLMEVASEAVQADDVILSDDSSDFVLLSEAISNLS